MKIKKWKKYTFEFLSIFIAVVSAFALTNWNDNIKTEHSEQKILTEIKNGINRDFKDFNANISGHNLSLRSNSIFRDLIQNKPISQDSIGLFYIVLFRDYTPIINSSGYESLKENGLKTISNDSLRFQIVTLYDYYYSIIKIVDKVTEMQSYDNYFASINKLLSPYMEFDSSGKLKKISNPTGLSGAQRKEILSYLWRLEVNRNYKIKRYDFVKNAMKKVEMNISKELKQ